MESKLNGMTKVLTDTVENFPGKKSTVLAKMLRLTLEKQDFVQNFFFENSKYEIWIRNRIRNVFKIGRGINSFGYTTLLLSSLLPKNL